MREVEPQGGKPDEVENDVVPLREGVGDQRGTVRGAVAQRVHVVAHDLHELHLRPEVVEVQPHAEQNDDTQYEHVLRGPGHARLLYGDGVALRAACAVVVQREDDGVDEVDQHAEGQDNRTGQCVPVGAQKFTDRVVRLGRDDRSQVHGHVEEDKEHEEAARHAHH